MAILSHEYWKKFIEKDKNGKDVTEEKILDLILVQNVFIEKAID